MIFGDPEKLTVSYVNTAGMAQRSCCWTRIDQWHTALCPNVGMNRKWQALGVVPESEK